MTLPKLSSIVHHISSAAAGCLDELAAAVVFGP
jgi:hypothetical protein